MRNLFHFAALGFLALSVSGIGSGVSELRAAVTDTGTDGASITLAQGETVTSDGVTGSGALTVSTTGFVMNDASTFGTLQFTSGASLSGFTGTLNLQGAHLDLNGNSLSAASVGAASTTSGTVTTYDRASTITNTASAQASVTLSSGTGFYAQLGNADGTNSNISLTWNTTATRLVGTTQYHTGGSSFTDGALQLAGTSGVAAPDVLGSGAISFSNLKVTALSNGRFSLSNAITLAGDVSFRMSGGSSLDFSGTVGGTGNFLIPCDGSTVTFSGVAKTYSGKTVIGTKTNAWGDYRASATLRIMGDNFLPTGTTLEFEGVYAGGNLDLYGHQQTVAKLHGDGTIKNAGTGASTLTLSSTDVNGVTTVGANTTLVVPAGNYVNWGSNGAGTVQLGAGASTIQVRKEMSAANLMLGGNTTFAVSPALWGKMTISGSAGDYSTAAAPTEWKADPGTELNNRTGQTATFPDNTTMSFSSYFNVTADTTLSFMKNFDDTGLVWVTPVNEDGTLGTAQAVVRGTGSGDVGTVLYFGAAGDTSPWNDVIVGSMDLAPGRYFIEVRAGQGSGGVGPNYSGNSLGFGVKSGANTDLAGISAYQNLAIDENGFLAGISTVQAVSGFISVNSNMVIPAGATVTFDAGSGGKVTSAGILSGTGALALKGTNGAEMVLKQQNSFSGGTNVNVPKLTLGEADALGSGTVTFDSATEVVLDETLSARRATPWNEGAIVKTSSENYLQTTAMPETVTQTANATHTGTSIGKFTTWVYQSETLVSDADFTMFFGKMLDDAACLKISDLTSGTTETLLSGGTWSDFLKGSYDFQEGHRYALDLRVFNGDGGEGPVTGNYNISSMKDGVGIGASLTDFTGGTEDQTNFVLMNFTGGSLIGSPLHQVADFAFRQNLVLNQDVSIDAQNAGPVTFDGSITGNGALTLRNGDFTMKGAETEIGGFSLENSTYQMSQADGMMKIHGDLNLEDATICVDLGSLEGVSGWSAFEADGNVAVNSGTEWVLSYDGEPESMMTSVLLIKNPTLPDDFWESMTYTLENPELRATVQMTPNGLAVLFGDSSALPEPSAWLLLLLGFGGLVRIRKKLS